MIRPDTLVALSALHPDPSAKVMQALSVSSLYSVADSFTEEEQQAIRDFRAAGRACYAKLGKQARSQLVEVGDNIFAANETAEDAEKSYDEELEAMNSFWETATKSSVGAASLEEEYDLRRGSWLGNGKWGWVMMAPKKQGSGQAVLKLSDVHHADVTAKEWVYGSKMGRGHRNIVEYLNVYLYGDENQTFKKRLQDGYREGKLKSDIQRKNFPTHYVCMTIEQMNCGSVQNWLDKEMLSPQGMMVVLKEVAAALAYMHANEITHNDMKPENIFLHSDGRRIVSKLGDLGLAEKSTNTTSDVTRYGMTGFSMATGEKYGTRHFSKAQISSYVAEVEACVNGCGVTGRLGEALMDLPKLFQKVFSESVTMTQVKDWKSLQGFDFLDEGSSSSLRRSSTDPVAMKSIEEDDDYGYPSSRSRLEKAKSSLEPKTKPRRRLWDED